MNPKNPKYLAKLSSSRRISRSTPARNASKV